MATTTTPHSARPHLRNTDTAEDAGKLLLRLAVGVLIFLHVVPKLAGGVEGIAGMLAQKGLPGVLAYGVYIGEGLAPLLMILGLWTRPAALVVALNMLFAIGLAHMGELFTLGKQGGWALELQGMFLFGALAVALLGAGRMSAGGIHGRWN